MATTAATTVGLIAAAGLGFVLLMSHMFLAMPQSDWAGILVGGLLIVVFGFTFTASSREVLDKLTPQ